VSDAPPGELLDLAQRVAGAGRAGEEVEAYVVRSRETEGRVFDGDVESLSMAGVEGVGVRVISDHRQGFAWAGSLETAVVDETLDEARDNAAFGEPDEWYGVATPTEVNGATPPALDLWREELASVPTEEKVRIALELERATKAADARIRNIEAASYGDALAEAALVNSLGVEAHTRRTICSASLPITSRFRPRRPCVQMTMRSACHLRACRTIGSAASAPSCHGRAGSSP